jgi:hypothetical protein
MRWKPASWGSAKSDRQNQQRANRPGGASLRKPMRKQQLSWRRATFGAERNGTKANGNSDQTSNSATAGKKIRHLRSRENQEPTPLAIDRLD